MLPKFQESFDNLTKGFVEIYANYEQEMDAIVARADNYDKFWEKAKDIIKQYKSETQQKENEENEQKNSSRTRTKQKKNVPESVETEKEDIKPIDLPTRSKRLASQVASVMISKCSTISDTTKLRRPSDGVDLLAQYKSKVMEEVVIKREKEDSYTQPDTTKESAIETTHNNSENDMPPPAVPPKSRGRFRKIKQEVDSSDTECESSSRPVRSTRTKRNNQNSKIDNKPVTNSSWRKNKNSDVLIVPEEIPVIDLIDSSIDESVNPPDPPESPKEKGNKEKKNKETTKKKAQQASPVKTSEESSPEKAPKETIVPPEIPEVIPEKPTEKKKAKRDENYTSDEDNLPAKKKTKKVRTKVSNKKPEKTQVPEKIPVVLLEHIKQERIPEEDIPVPQDKISLPKAVDATFDVGSKSSGPIDQTFDFGNKKTNPKAPVLNETFAPAINSTYCRSPALDATVTIEKHVENTKIPVISDPKPNETRAILSEVDAILKPMDNLKAPESAVRVSIERNPIIEKLVEDNKKKSLEKEESDPVVEEKDDHWKKPVPDKLPVLADEPLLTDDESDISPAKSIPKTPKNNIISCSSSSSEEQVKPKKGLKTKAVFSPYANSPVKKRVAAFEKLGSTEKPKALAQTTRVTRTKTKKILEEKENALSKTEQKPNSKFTTPMNKQKLKIFHSDLKPTRPALTNTTSKQNVSNSSTSVSNESQKSNSAIKLTKAELLAKAEEAQKKKLALIAAKTEECKRIREEKQVKAQKIREEKEKQKEEKLKLKQQMLQEKEEKLKETQDELQAWRAQQKKIEENEKRRQQQQQEHAQNLKKYQEENKKKYKVLPPLPTLDCYDSDDETRKDRPKPVFPEWTQRNNLLGELNKQRLIPKEVMKKFFNIKPITPDLETIFEHIPKAICRRNSSAVWRTPPRFSMLPKH